MRGLIELDRYLKSIEKEEEKQKVVTSEDKLDHILDLIKELQYDKSNTTTPTPDTNNENNEIIEKEV